jgi:hypothetical protein
MCDVIEGGPEITSKLITSREYFICIVTGTVSTVKHSKCTMQVCVLVVQFCSNNFFECAIFEQIFV